MGRKKIIEDDVLLKLLESFYEKECKCNANRLKLPEIADYVRHHGYPDYTVETLRRNPLARSYIDGKKQTAEDTRLVTLVCHKPIDVDAFLATHPTRSTLRQGLVKIDGHYKVVADTAAGVIKEHNALKAKLEDAVEALKRAQEENQTLKEALAAAKQDVTELKSRVRMYKGIVDDYVYPGVANELLLQDGVLSETSTGIDPDKLEVNIITSGTVVNPQTKLRSGSSVLELFSKQCGDE